MKKITLTFLFLFSLSVFAEDAYRSPAGAVTFKRPQALGNVTNPNDAALVAAGWELVSVTFSNEVVVIPRPAYSNEVAGATIAAVYLTPEELALPAPARVALFKARVRQATRGGGPIDARFEALADGVDAQDHLLTASALGGGYTDKDYLKPTRTQTNQVRVVTPR